MDDAALRAHAEELMAEFERLRAGAGDLRRRMMAARGEATSPDGLIKAVVGNRGHLERLEIDPRVYRRPDSRRLAEDITDTIRRAAAEADKRIEEAAQGYLSANDVRNTLGFDVEAIFTKLDEQLEPLTRES
ncbi:YbaB/EbfC family nucleoid-associated protein [Actinomycetes bacterium KLBMP 9797]